MNYSQQSLKLKNTELLIKRLALIEQGLDSTEATKMKQLMKKLESGEQHFLFSGHFSAGKSTLINELFETNILPSSPIPASANTVRVRPGDPLAVVDFFNGKRMVFQAPYNIETVKNYCLNGNEVAQIELSAPSSYLEKDVVLIDTPGIDSTDEAHRLATENSMYLADVVFYVMDYNHVQSEVNYQFIRELHRQNKKVILIVNQIDKHNESELSFRSFKKSVASSFEAWGMTLESFFFISLKDRKHPHNQFDQLKAYIEGLAKKTKEEKIKKIYDSAHSLVDEVTDLKPEDEAVNKAYLKMNKAISTYKERMDTIEEDFQTEASKITKSAMLMPYEVRESGRAYLESLQPGFKVGVIFREKKTEQERELRFETFVENLKEQVKAQLEWHFQQLLLELEEAAGIKNKNSLNDFELSVDYSIIKKEAEKGTGATGEAVLHYTENIANLLKSQVKQKSERMKDILLMELQEEFDTLKASERNNFINLVGDKRATEFLKRLDELRAVRERFEQVLVGSYDSEARVIDTSYINDQEVMDVEYVEPDAVTTSKKKERVKKREDNEVISENTNKLPSRNNTIDALYKTAETVKDIPGLDQTRRSLISRADKLQHKSYTVALFGAFSAGKSSFANALLGESILPSSPNPTTATLNRICPVSNENEHEMADIFYKSENELLKDIQHSLSFFGEKTFSIEDSLRIIENGKIFARESSDTKPHALFLKAVWEGRAQLDYLGERRTVSIDEFKELVVNESKACFIASISLYYDNSLTRKGITLVDTPGADSINARHTGVAFQYIKEADAILYVTYYNHAFSKADREFLIQLGRVKDVFEMDKMFFLLNAADLAQDEEELEVVQDHVTKQLGQYGIRKPSLYPVSSLAAISSKKVEEGRFSNLPDVLKERGGINQFEGHFYRFIESDLSRMAIQSNWSELKRVNELLVEWLNNFDLNQEQKNSEIKRLRTSKSDVLHRIDNYYVKSTESKIEQEIEELVHYIPQRLFYRFSDFYKEAFNPSSLTGKEGLTKASNNLLVDINRDLTQEMRAASLRLDHFIKHALRANHRELYLLVTEKLSDFQSEVEDIQEMETPDFEASLSEYISSEHLLKVAKSEFKNTKQFFEQGGSDDLQNKLSTILEEPVKEYLKKKKELLVTVSLNHYEEAMQTLSADMKNTINHHVETQLEMKNSTVSKELLSEKLHELSSILSDEQEVEE